MTRDFIGFSNSDPKSAILTAKTAGAGLVLAGFSCWLFSQLLSGGFDGAWVVLLSGVLLPVSRPLIHSLSRLKTSTEGIVILGTGKIAGKIYREMLNAKCGRFQGFVSTGGPLSFESGADGSGLRLIHYSQLKELAREKKISRVVVAEPEARNRKELTAALLDCRLSGLEVEHAPESYERLNRKVWLEALPPDWLIHSDGLPPSPAYRLVKQVMDFIGALVLLLMAAPLMALAAIAIKLESSGPALFPQVRVGLNGKEFVLYKFRSMREDAELASGPVWSGERDPRVTRLGATLRKYRIDELPQLFNVLRGDMSLVGPRPERPYFIQVLRRHIPYYDLRHSVKPGVTGWAQVRYSYGASIEDAYEKLQYALYYARRMSLSFDLAVLVRTVEVVLFARGR